MEMERGVWAAANPVTLHLLRPPSNVLPLHQSRNPKLNANTKGIGVQEHAGAFRDKTPRRACDASLISESSFFPPLGWVGKLAINESAIN